MHTHRKLECTFRTDEIRQGRSKTVTSRVLFSKHTKATSRGKPLFVNVKHRGVIHWYPDRDGGVWALGGKGFRPELGYHFSQSPLESRPGLPPAGKWRSERSETHGGSEYPKLKISTKYKKAHTDVGEFMIEVSGCTGSLSDCNGHYEYQRMHKGKPLFVNSKTHKGVFHWMPEKDGGIWALFGKGTQPTSGYNFSQSSTGDAELPPGGQWRYQRSSWVPQSLLHSGNIQRSLENCGSEFQIHFRLACKQQRPT